MDWLFGRRMTPDEMLRKNQRALNKAMRELDRERAKMEQQEKKIIADIKKMAKQGQMDAVKIMAKVRISLNSNLRTRKHSFCKSFVKSIVCIKMSNLRKSAFFKKMRNITIAFTEFFLFLLLRIP